jgi:hypothetical protein
MPSAPDSPLRIYRRGLIQSCLTALLLSAATEHRTATAGLQDPAEQASLQQQIAQLSETLRSAEVVSGQFTQLREIKGLNKPLQSSGHFIYWRDRGIYWHTELPFPQAITYTQQHTISWTAPGIPSKDKHNSRKDKQFRQMLLTMFSFDLSQLEQQFSSQWQIDEPQWQLLLTPSNRLTRRGLQSATLSGQQFIQQILIINPQGEQLQISFSDMLASTGISQTSCIDQFGFSAEDCQSLSINP